MSVPVVWITGRPAAGKTTLADRLAHALVAAGVRATVLDSDEMRAYVTPNPRYTDEERAMLYRALAYAAERIARERIIPVVAATAHSAQLRAVARARAKRFFLIYAKAPSSLCEHRDPKALYRKAHAESEGTMPGVHVPYEEPNDADVIVDTSTRVSDEAVQALAERIVGEDLSDR